MALIWAPSEIHLSFISGTFEGVTVRRTSAPATVSISETLTGRWEWFFANLSALDLVLDHTSTSSGSNTRGMALIPEFACLPDPIIPRVPFFFCARALVATAAEAPVSRETSTFCVTVGRPAFRLSG
ncbi:MAG: hypothetical protein BWY05_01423 [Euryarchaeota archaeon ADurb.Bin165]|nr:MAG: hypothetical protein BWY05_01423 [Euryarchaeota archaeon ADurb.Bin165]